MIDADKIVPHEIRAMAAYELLVSSTAARYVRTVRALATSHAFRLAIETLNLTTPELVETARALTRIISAGSQRHEREADLSLLVGYLSSFATSDVDSLLKEIGMNDAPGLAWVSAAARLLHFRRSSNQTIGNAATLLGVHAHGDVSRQDSSTFELARAKGRFTVSLEQGADSVFPIAA